LWIAFVRPFCRFAGLPNGINLSIFSSEALSILFRHSGMSPGNHLRQKKIALSLLHYSRDSLGQIGNGFEILTFTQLI
jgi:hypothetical protein